MFNCGYGTGYTVLEVLRSVEKAAGRPLNVKVVGRRAGDPTAIVAGADKARRVLGWRPRHQDIDEIVATALAWEERLSRRNSAA